MARWGLTVPMPMMPLAAHRELVSELSGLGYTDVWSAETAGADAFTPLALASQWAPELRLGTAIVPVYTRGPALLAMSAATLADLAPGRFVLGIGASSPPIVKAWNGMEFEAPYARTRDTLRFLKQAMTGEKVTAEFDTFTVRGFRLEKAPDVQPQIMLAALRPGMLRLAATEADGAITNWLSADDVAKVRAEVGTDTELAARIFVCPTEDAEFARTIGRRMISSYLTVPVYAAFHDWLGNGELLKPMHEAWAAGDRALANEVIPDELVDALVLHGTTEQIRAEVQRYVDNGLDTPLLAVVPVGGDPFDAARALAPGA